MSELEEGKLTEAQDKELKNGTCPACVSTNFYRLAPWRVSRNIACENGHIFWFSPPVTSHYISFDAQLGERIKQIKSRSNAPSP